MTTVRDKPSTEVTLADLLPDGCTVFRFQYANETLVAARDTNGRWTVTSRNAWWGTLDALAAYFDINLGTVVPLVVDPQYVEERR